MTQPAMVAALQAGAVQGISAGAPFSLTPVVNGDGVLWISGPRGELPAANQLTSSACLQTSLDYAKAHPETISRLRAVFDDLAALIKTKPEQAEAMLGKAYPQLAPKLLDAAFAESAANWSQPRMTPDDIRQEIKVQMGAGIFLASTSWTPRPPCCLGRRLGIHLYDLHDGLASAMRSESGGGRAAMNSSAVQQRGAQARLPLSGITVIDLSHVYNGPYATLLMALAGARVIKVEPKGGEHLRSRGDMGGADLPFAMLNSNKETVTLNLKDARGKDLLRDMVKRADVLIENFAPGVMERLGLGAAALLEINPRLIYGSSSGYGTTGRIVTIRRWTW